MLRDFRTSEYARLQTDSVFDKLVNKKGEIIDKIEGKDIQEVGAFSDGIAYVKTKEGYGFINAKAQIQIPIKYNLAQTFGKYLAIVKKEGFYFLIDRKGNQVGKKYRDIVSNEKYFKVKEDNVKEDNIWGLLDEKGEIKLSPEFQELGDFKEGLAKVKKENKWGFIRLDGTYKLKPSIYAEAVGHIRNGLIWIARKKSTHAKSKFRYDHLRLPSTGLCEYQTSVYHPTQIRLYRSFLS